jgi:hypothetical protein
MGRSQREKGSRAEREFINEIQDELGDFFGDIDKNWNQREETRFDLKLGPFGVEIKRQEKLSVGSWWDEAVHQTAGSWLMPMLAYRLNFKPWTIVMALTDVSYLMSGEATNLAIARDNMKKPWTEQWHNHISFSIAMPLPAFGFFCREYIAPEVARGETPP